MLEDVLEEAVVFLQDGVLCGELKWVASVEGILHASSGKAVNRLLSVVHTQGATWTIEVMNDLGGWCAAIFWMENHFSSSWYLIDGILSSILITICMSSYNDWLGPAWNNSWNVTDNNWLSEYSTVQDISNGTVW
jgi:hypothetical protein